MSRRCRFEALLDILRVIAAGESKPTRIMYCTNTGWMPLNEALRLLREAGLIAEKPAPARGRRGPDGRSRKAYEITDRGLEALSAVDHLREITQCGIIGDLGRIPRRGYG